MRVKSGLAEMLKGGVIMDVVDAEQAKIAEEAGACAVMALERVPADIRRDGGVARMSDPGHDQGDPGGRHDPGDGEVPHRPLRRGADPAVARDRLHRRVRGADARRPRAPRRQVAVHRPVRLRLHQPRRGAPAHRRGRRDDPHEGRGRDRRHRQRGHPHALRLRRHPPAAVAARARSCSRRPRSCRRRTSSSAGSPSNGRLPVVTFTAGGIATPADASLCMQLGADGVFVGSGIFKSGDPVAAGAGDRRGDDALHGRGRAGARVSAGLGEAMVGISTQSLDPSDLLETAAGSSPGCWSPAAAAGEGDQLAPVTRTDVDARTTPGDVSLDSSRARRSRTRVRGVYEVLSGP